MQAHEPTHAGTVVTPPFQHLLSNQHKTKPARLHTYMRSFQTLPQATFHTHHVASPCTHTYTQSYTHLHARNHTTQHTHSHTCVSQGVGRLSLTMQQLAWTSGSVGVVLLLEAAVKYPPMVAVASGACLGLAGEREGGPGERVCMTRVSGGGGEGAVALGACLGLAGEREEGMREHDQPCLDPPTFISSSSSSFTPPPPQLPYLP